MLTRYLLLITFFLLSFAGLVSAKEQTVIASNGAGKGLIEHTLVATTLAATTDIDYLELHVIMTSDDHLIVFRDLTLNRLTDVAELFPDRNREDGGFYAIDFTLNEIRQLRLNNVFEGPHTLSLPIPTLAEELALVRTLETQLGKQIGLAIEIRNPRFHTEANKAISETTLDTITSFGYGSGTDKLYLQCFDPEELQRIHDELLPIKQLNIPIIQLIGQNEDNGTKQQSMGNWRPYNYDWLFTNIGLRVVISYAAAIGLPTTSIADQTGNLLLIQYIDKLHQYGLKVFVYPVDNNPELLQHSAETFPALLHFYYTKAQIDGIYTDSYKDALAYNIIKNAPRPEPATKLPSFFSQMEFSDSPVNTRENATKQQTNVEVEFENAN